ncbi:hypothetical protein ACF0H5_019779 [Mactra antiquata]
MNILLGSNDGFIVYPLDAIGKEYYIINYHPSSEECQFMIVATENNTNVVIQYASNSGIQISYDNNTFGPGDTQTMSMQKFDVLQVQDNADLTGTYIKADKNIVVISGNKLTAINPFTNDTANHTGDTLVEQLAPVNTWGKKFGLVATPDRTTGDIIKFVGSENDTSIFLQCSDGTEEPSDPSFVTIVPFQQYSHVHRFRTPHNYYTLFSRLYETYFIFIIKQKEIKGLRINGQPLSSPSYQKIPGTSYVGGYVKIPYSFYIVSHIKTNVYFGGYLYGAIAKESYMMTTGLRLAPINSPCEPTTSEFGDGIDNDCDGMIDEDICENDERIRSIGDDCARVPPVHGQWSVWRNELSRCYCSGMLYKERQCNSPEPANGGNPCFGDNKAFYVCKPTTNCRVDGNWSPWTGSTCSKTCGSGTYFKYRFCDSPKPDYGGSDCFGEHVLIDECSSMNCNGLLRRGALDHIGKEFIFGIPENKGEPLPAIMLHISTPKTTAVYVEISTPRYDDMVQSLRHFTVMGTTSEMIFIDSGAYALGTKLSTKAVHIIASDDIVVYCMSTAFGTNDGFIVYPLDAIGKEYYAISYYPSSEECQFMIVATENDTNVVIKYANNSGINISYGDNAFGPGDIQTISIRKFDVFQVQDNVDLTGTYITADKNIVVISGNKYTNINPLNIDIGVDSSSTLVEQLPPVNAWGKKFGFVATPNRTTGDIIKFVGSENDTSIFLQCSDGTDEPSDPSFVTIVPFQQYSHDHRFRSPQNYFQQFSYLYETYFIFIIKKKEVDGLLINGQPLSSPRYKRIPGTSYVGGYVKPCEPTISEFGDGIDNDCDGKIDEDICDYDDNMRFIGDDCARVTPVHGQWSDFGNEASRCYCSRMLYKERYCNSPEPANGGNPCFGSNKIFYMCEPTSECRVDGNWSPWTGSTCSKTCGNGTYFKYRFCDNPKPDNGGTDCFGANGIIDDCNMKCNYLLRGGLENMSVRIHQRYFILPRSR